MICPKCGRERAHRCERVGWKDQALNRISLKPYSCRDCQHRFHAFPKGGLLRYLKMELAERKQQFGRNRRMRGTMRDLALFGLAALTVAFLLYFFAAPNS